MNNNFLLILLTIFTGALIPVMAASNGAFGKSIGSPLLTGLMVFVTGLAAIILFMLFTRTAPPSLGQLKAAPGIGYIGGIIVAFYVVMITILAPRLGVGNAIACIVTGQILCAIMIDHFGLLNAVVRPISLMRIIGALFMILGVYLVMRKGSAI